MDEYFSNIKQFAESLDPDTLSALQGISKTRTYRKGDFLLRQGEVCRHSYSVAEGILRRYYIHDGKEITTGFFFQDDIAVTLESYCLQQPSREFIQALTDTVVTQTDYRLFQKAKTAFPKLVAFDLLLTEYYSIWLENRLFEFRTLDATRRYSLLLERQPHLLQKIPLTHIASYLGISLETLSRIRARI